MKDVAYNFISRVIRETLVDAAVALVKSYPDVMHASVDACSSLCGFISKKTGSVDSWIREQAFKTEDACEVSEIPKMTEEPTVRVSKEKFDKLKRAYCEWLDAQEFLDNCDIPQTIRNDFRDFSLTGRIIALSEIVKSNQIPEELSFYLDNYSFIQKDNNI